MLTADGDEALETEDLVDADIYAAAVNGELACWGTTDTVDASDLGSTLRTKALDDWCERNHCDAPDKVAVAERIIEMSAEEPIFDTERQSFLQELRAQLAARLGIS